MSVTLAAIYDLAWRFVPAAAAEARLYTCGARSWWPAHEIGHFLVATSTECRTFMFGLDAVDADDAPTWTASKYHYVISRETAATSISQRLLRRFGHTAIADQEIEYTDENTLECGRERWCRRAVDDLLRANHAVRLPDTLEGLETLLTRKACMTGTKTYPSRRAAATGRMPKKMQILLTTTDADFLSRLCGSCDDADARTWRVAQRLEKYLQQQINRHVIATRDAKK